MDPDVVTVLLHFYLRFVVVVAFAADGAGFLHLLCPFAFTFALEFYLIFHAADRAAVCLRR